MTKRLTPEENSEQDLRLTQDLQRLFHDQRRGANFYTTLYKRLEADRASLLDREARSQSPLSPGSQRDHSRINKRESRHTSRALSTIAATVIMALIVGSLVFLFKYARPSSTTTSGGIVQIPVTISSLYMLDRQIGWALTEKGQLIRTRDGGLHWHNVSPPPPFTANPARTVVRVLDAAHAWVAVPGNAPASTRIFRTRDSGQSWQSSTVQTSVVIQITFVNPQIGWLLSRQRTSANAEGASVERVQILRSSDGGQSWTLVSNVLPASTDVAAGRLPYGGQKTGISFLDAQTGWVTGSYAAPGYPLLFRTRDGGQTWYPQTLKLAPSETATQLALTAPHFFSMKDGILPVSASSGNGTSVMVYTTHDGGNSWQGTTPIAASASLTNFVDTNSGWTSDGTHLARTSTGGQQWKRLETNPPLRDLSSLTFVSPTLGWAIGSTPNNGPALLKTTDGGLTWKILQALLV